MIEVIKNKKGSSYRARIYWLDKRTISETFSRKEDAKAWERRKLQERSQIRAYGAGFQDGVIFGEFASIWIKQRVESRLSISTRRVYMSDLKLHIFPILQNVVLRDISQQHGHRMIARMRVGGSSPKTINNVVGLLQGILNDAVRWNYISRNPLLGIGSLKLDPTPDRFWTPSEVNQFLRANFRDPYYPFYLVAINTGLRRGELAGLKWDRVRSGSEKMLIEVTRALSRHGLAERTKTAQKRVIPVNEAVRETLLKLLKAQKSDFVFTEGDGGPLEVNHVYRRFREAQVRAGISNRIRFHDLRHTFASNFMMNGGNLYDLQKLLGHTSIKMTERYAHLAPEHLERTVGIVCFRGGDFGGDNPEIIHESKEETKKALISRAF
jgi:integrase